MKSKTVVFLGVRRLVLHMLAKVDGAKAPADYLTFHALHPKNVPSGFRLPETAPPPQSRAERMLRESITMLFDGSADEILESLLSGNSSLSALELLANKEIEGIVHFKAVLEKQEQEKAEKAAVVLCSPQKQKAETADDSAAAPSPAKENA